MRRSRHLEPLVRKAAATFPAVVVTGPRQSGKTTLLRAMFDATHHYALAPGVRAVPWHLACA